MHYNGPAILCAVRTHGEHGAVVRVLTEAQGLLPGYVRGARSRTMRPILQPGNHIAVDLRSRNDDQLAAISADLIKTRAPLMVEPMAAATIEWVTALAAIALPEAHPYPQVYHALDGVLLAIESAPSGRRWAPALIGYETLVLRQLGYGDEGQAWMGDADQDWPALLDRLARQREALYKHIFADHRRDTLAARDRLMARLKRAVA